MTTERSFSPAFEAPTVVEHVTAQQNVNEIVLAEQFGTTTENLRRQMSQAGISVAEAARLADESGQSYEGFFGDSEYSTSLSME